MIVVARERKFASLEMIDNFGVSCFVSITGDVYPRGCWRWNGTFVRLSGCGSSVMRFARL